MSSFAPIHKFDLMYSNELFMGYIKEGPDISTTAAKVETDSLVCQPFGLRGLVIGTASPNSRIKRLHDHGTRATIWG